MKIEDMTVSATNRNAEHSVTEALRCGIYTMVCTAFSIKEDSIQRMRDAMHVSIRNHDAEDILAIATRPALSSVTPRDRGVILIVYNKTLSNPYMNYKFLHNSIIVRDSRRELEQTTQLIYDAQAKRKPELDDLIIHTCVTKQNGQRRFLIIMCRGVDEYRRVFYRNGKRVALHDNPEPEQKIIADRYMVRMLTKHGNTVADPAFIKKYGVKGTAMALAKALGDPIYIRQVLDETGEYYICETARRRRKY